MIKSETVKILENIVPVALKAFLLLESLLQLLLQILIISVIYSGKMHLKSSVLVGKTFYILF